jgi:receptor expression-enhancing protein 5/6
MDKFTASLADFNAALASFDILNQLEEKSKVPKAAIVVGGGLVTAGILWALFGPGLLTNLIGFVFPTWASFKAIESPDKDDDTQWLTYWVVFSFLSIPETFADVLEGYITLYYPFKFAFLVWLFAPQTRGADWIYKNGLRKFLLTNESRIDQAAEVAEKVAVEAKAVVQEEFVQVEKPSEPAEGT